MSKHNTLTWAIGYITRAMPFSMAKKLSLPIILLSSTLLLLSFQSSTFELASTIKQTHSFISTDQLGNLYVVGDYSIHKYTKEGKLLNLYQDYSNGKITQIDVSNPMKTVVFHKDFLKVVVLDKTLSLLSQLDLQQFGYVSVDAITYTRDERLWLYDAANFQLVKLNKSGNKSNESAAMNLLLDENLRPTFLLEHEQKVFVYDTDNGLYVFDQFGGYEKRIPITGLKQFQMLDKEMRYFEDGQLKEYNFTTLATNVLLTELPITFSEGRIEKDRVYLSDGKQVTIYKI